MRKLEHLISQLESNVRNCELTVAHISTGSVGWHIEHSLLVLDLVMEALAKSNPGDYKAKFDIRRSALMLTQKIPRGRIKAPTAVRPTINFNEATLQQHISLTRDRLRTIERLSAGKFFTHPFLGDFKLRPAIKFLMIHTQHHFRIIQDIVKSKG